MMQYSRTYRAHGDFSHTDKQTCFLQNKGSDTVAAKTTKNIEGARIMQYKTEQVVLKEKFIGHDAKNLVALDNMLNKYAASGWTLCTMTTTVAGGTGLGGGDRTVFTLIFQKI